jgi:hypothetical protein
VSAFGLFLHCLSEGSSVIVFVLRLLVSIDRTC